MVAAAKLDSGQAYEFTEQAPVVTSMPILIHDLVHMLVGQVQT